MIPDGELHTTYFAIEAQFQPSVCGDGEERWVAFPQPYATLDGALEAAKLMNADNTARVLRSGLPTGFFRVVRVDTLTVRHIVAMPPKIEPVHDA